jgi:hypothetical protein
MGNKKNVYSHEEVINLITEVIVDSGRTNNKIRAKTMAKAWLEIKIETGTVKPLNKGCV